MVQASLASTDPPRRIRDEARRGRGTARDPRNALPKRPFPAHPPAARVRGAASVRRRPLVHAFRFDDGVVHYRGRFVENECYAIEQAAGRFCMDGFQTHAAEKTDKVLYRVQPNTNVVFHGGKLMALVENAFPFEIDARTLAPLARRLRRPPPRHVGFGPPEDRRAHRTDGDPRLPALRAVRPALCGRARRPLLACRERGSAVPGMMHDGRDHRELGRLDPAAGGDRWRDTGERRQDVPRVHDVGAGARPAIRHSRRERESPTRWLRAPTEGFIFHPGNAYERTATSYSMLARMFAATTYSTTRLRVGVAVVHGRGVGSAAVPLRDRSRRGARAGATARRSRCGVPRLDDRLVGYKNRFGYAVRLNRDERGPTSHGRQSSSTTATAARASRMIWRRAIPERAGVRAAHASSDGGTTGSCSASSTTGRVTAPTWRSWTPRIWRDGTREVPPRAPHPDGFHGNFAAGVV